MIYLIRHGKDLEGFVGGWSNIELTEQGRKKIKKKAKWIKENLTIKKIISSDVKRAIETAEIISHELKMDFETTSVLREQNKGDLNGKPIEELTMEEVLLKDNSTIDTVYPNGESLKDLYNRINNNLDFFKNLEDDTLIVTHRGVINMLYYILNNIELDMNKKQFDVTHGSIRMLDMKNKTIKRID